VSSETIGIVEEYVRRILHDRGKARPVVVGICGAQGSGKSTLVEALAQRLEAEKLKVCTLSLDDLYVSRADRMRLASSIHPLFAVRGVPGTHDVAMGIDLLDALKRGESVLLPSFDKAVDDRAPRSYWRSVEGPVDVVFFEGWCVGAVPQDDHELAEPINALEAERDPDRTWRRAVNEALAAGYQDLFARIDSLIFLKAMDFEIVASWRLQQEETLRARLEQEGRSAAHLMDERAIHEFISHYERLTRHILSEMADRANLVIPLDTHRRPLGPP